MSSSVAEWSKALVLRHRSLRTRGLNPTAAKLYFLFLFFFFFFFTLNVIINRINDTDAVRC